MSNGIVRPIGDQTQTSDAAKPLKSKELRKQQKTVEDEIERENRPIENGKEDGRHC
jgi:hypothetical protein